MNTEEPKQELVSQVLWKTPEEKVKWVEENISPLIRYGYNQACLDILEYADNYLFEDFTAEALIERVKYLMVTKKQVVADDLKKEFVKD